MKVWIQIARRCNECGGETKMLMTAAKPTDADTCKLTDGMGWCTTTCLPQEVEIVDGAIVEFEVE